MTMYRVSLLDHDGTVANSQTAEGIPATAALLVALGACTGQEWAKPLLDELGEFTAEVRAEGGRILTVEESAILMNTVERYGAVVPTDDDELGLLRWNNPERQT